jgi:hypothetical protein
LQFPDWPLIYSRYSRENGKDRKDSADERLVYEGRGLKLDSKAVTKPK